MGTLRFVVRRLLFGIVVIWLIGIFVFALSRAAGDPRNLYLDEYATQEQWDAWGERMGLDKPLYVQYGRWFGNVMRGKFETSLHFRRDPISVFWEHFGVTAQLGAGAFGVAIFIGIPVGVISAVKRGNRIDYVTRFVALLGQAMPVFWIGLLMIMIFSVQLRWLPTSGAESWRHFVLPTVALGWLPAASLMRITRSAMLNILDSEYIKLARAKGASSKRVIWVHAFRNALIAPLTLSALILAAFLTGTVVVETVFALPGVGRIAITAIKQNDFPMMSAVVMIFAGMYIGLSLIVDLLYARIDPRIRLT